MLKVRESLRGPRVLITLALVVAAAALAVASATASSGSNGTVKIGVMTTLSGPAGLYGKPVSNSVKLAADEINASGGIGGKKVTIVVADDAGSPAGGLKAAQLLLLKNKVDGLVAMTNSAVRNAVMPLVSRNGLPFIYTSLYEGHACYKNLFVLGEVPRQYTSVYRYAVSALPAKKWYLVGHDYVWPQTVLPLAKKDFASAGASVVGQDLVPFGTTDFASILGKIKSSGADGILVALVGSDFGAFLKQWRSFGLDRTTKMVTLTMTDDFMASLGKDAAGVYSIFGYFQDLKSARNRAFITKYRKAYGAKAAQTTLSEGSYDAVWLYALAARKAGSTASADVDNALKGLTFDAPRGRLAIDPKTHHVAQTMYLIRSDGAGTYKLVKAFPSISAGPQCSL
jgi:urea transport system substrate-binding protein